jgi:hypothetical protein
MRYIKNFKMILMYVHVKIQKLDKIATVTLQESW